MLKSQPAVSPTPTTSRPRKPRRTNLRLKTSSTPSTNYGVESRPTVTTPAYPTPAWGPSYYKPRPGFRRTLEELRASIGNDQNTSYILGDLLDARYGKMNDIRERYFQEQRYEAEHEYKLADIYAREGIEYEPDLPDIDGIPKGQGPQSIMRELMQQIAKRPNDQKYIEGISGVYQDRIEDAENIKNDMRDYRNSVEGYQQGHNNYLEELAAREVEGVDPDAKAPKRKKDADFFMFNPILDALDPERAKRKEVKKLGDYLGGTVDRAVGSIFSPTGADNGPSIGEYGHGLLNSLPGVGKLVPDDPPPVLRHIGDESSDAMFWTLDKLSRPLYGVASGIDTYAGMDDDKKEGDNTLWNSGVTGIDLGDSLGEFARRPWKPAQGFLEGFTSGGLGMSDAPTTFSDVIKNEAERNPEKNMYDSKQFQLWGGLSADLVADPLNFMGVGLVKKPLEGVHQGLNQIAKQNRIKQDAGKIGKFFDETEPMDGVADEVFTPKQIEEMLLGKGESPVNHQSRIHNMDVVRRNSETIVEAMARRQPRKGADAAEVEALRAQVVSRRNQIINETANYSYFDDLAKQLGVSKRKGEPTENIDEAVTTLALAQKFEMGMRFERRMDDIAKEKFGIVDEFGNGDGLALESHYEAMVEQFRRGGISQKNLDSFRNSIDDALDDSSNAAYDINEWMGGSWRADPRWSNLEARQLLRQADRLSRKDKGRRKAMTAEKSIQANIQKLEGDIEFYKKKGWNIQPLMKSIEDSKVALNFAQKQSHLRRADMMMRLMKAHVEFKAGGKTYKSPAEAAELMKARDRINAMKEEGPVGDANVYTIGERGLDGDEQPDMSLLNEEGLFDEGLLEPSPKFKDRASQLDYLSRRIANELKGMQYHPDRPFNVEQAKNRLLDEIPPYFNGEEGFDFERLQSHFDVNPKNGTVSLRLTEDPSVDNWLTDLKSIFEQEYAVNWKSRYQSKNRRRNEAKQGAVAEAKLEVTPEGQKILSMFKSKGGDENAAFGSKGLFPFVKVEEQALTQGEFAKVAVPTAGDRKTHAFVDGLLKELKNPEEAIRHQAVGRLRDKLYEANYSVPRSPQKASEWVLNHLDRVALDFKPENVAFRRVFKEQHGMDLREAIRARDMELGLAVGKGMHPNSKWRKRYPNGVTKSDFISGATNTWEEFHRLTEAGPFHVKIGTRVSEKEARGAGQDMQKWAKDNFQALMRMQSGDRTRTLGRIYDSSLKAQQKSNKGADDLPKAAAEIEKKRLSSSDYDEIREKATQDTWRYIRNDIEKGTLPIEIENQSLKLLPNMDSYSTPQELYQIMKYRLGAQEADFKFQRGIALKNKDQAEYARLGDELKALEARKAKIDVEHAKRMENVIKTREHIKKHLREDAYLRMAGLQTSIAQKSLTFNMVGQSLTIPGTKAMFKATDSMMDLPGISKMRQIMADAFRSPASRLEPTLVLARARSLGQTPIIIENDVKFLQRLFSGIHQNNRERTLKMWLNNAEYDTPEALAIQQAFDPTFMEHFQNKVQIGDGFLSLEDINKYMPGTMKMDLKRAGKFETPQQLIKHLQRSNPDSPTLKDPYRIAWEARIAYHQAAAKKAVDYMIYKGFGVRKVDKSDPAWQGVQGLQRLGWKEIPELSPGYLFTPDVIPDVRALLSMLEPRNIEQFGRIIDRATGYWKTITTVYNPGYWTRNAVGEAMSSWLGGVHGWKPYQKSSKVIGYARKDGQELDALKQQLSFMNYVPSESIKGNMDLGYTQGGHKLTPENVWVLYNDRGLKTGFFNTEFDHQYSVLGNKLRSNAGTDVTSKIHQGMRSGGEWAEDYFRLAHFIDAMEKSPAKSLAAAADEAADAVRKYHFDYTDFTNFEKTVMLRTFPFYKWTRKALPLMLTMLFQKPGKIMAYPKVMNTVSNSIDTHDIGGEDNGFAPNYEGIVPGWIQDLWAYQIGESGPHDEFGQQNEQYFNLATPQMDSYKAISNPLNTAYGLLNPLAKIPDQQIAEQATGHSLGDVMNGQGNYEFGSGDNSYQLDALKSLLKSTPQTNLIQKPLGENAELSHEDLWAFITGLGVYDSDSDRRRGEAYQ